MGLFGKKEPKPEERVEMPTKFGMGFGFGNQSGPCLCDRAGVVSAQDE